VIFLVGMILGTCVGFVCGLLWVQRPAVSSPEEGEHYGHPYAPVSYLRQRIASLPPNYAWEMVVTLNENGHHYLDVGLMDLRNGKELAGLSTDLTYNANQDFTWRECYRRYSSIDRSMFRNDLVGPILSWAEIRVNKLIAQQAQGTDSPIDYTLG
jgi:hypothetical protein